MGQENKLLRLGMGRQLYDPQSKRTIFSHSRRNQKNRVSELFETVFDSFPSLLLEDIFSVNASTKFVNSFLCLFMSEKRWLTESRPELFW